MTEFERGLSLPREEGRGDRQQRAAQAVADRVHLALRHDCPHRLQRVQHAETQVILHAEVAIFDRRIVPGDHEHGVTSTDEVAHQRIGGREIEDVVLHDPSRHDEDRLAIDLAGFGRILDQLDQAVAVDHLALRDRDVLARLERVSSNRRFATDRALPIRDEIHGAVDEVLPAFADGRLESFWICRDEINR